MAIFDLSKELLIFHDRNVKLNDADRRRLSEVRANNLKRVRDGLVADDRQEFKACLNQGGYAMQTVVNDPAQQSNHDIDIALIFDKDDLPAGALAARQRVRDALLQSNAPFNDPPEARTNAVTVWYADGYHVDFAVYRRSVDVGGQVVHEHAGADWAVRDPAEVTQWFDATVEAKSPKGSFVAVRPNQMRRVVRLIKWFSRSRASWDLPGGMIISTLVDECYRPHLSRDDVSVYETLKALKSRLDLYCQVYHPAGDGRDLTGKETYLKQVERLRDKLGMVIPKLEILETECTRDQARGAWDWVFNHSFWGGADVLAETAKLSAAEIRDVGHTVAMNCQYTTKGGQTHPYLGIALPRGMGLEFRVTHTTVPAPYDIRYEVQNTGDEAEAARTLNWSGNASSYNPVWTTSTAYAGRHRMTASIVKNGLTLARTSIQVLVAARKVSERPRRK